MMIFIINLAFKLTVFTIFLCAAASIYLIMYMIRKRNSIMKEFREEIFKKYEIEKE